MAKRRNEAFDRQFGRQIRYLRRSVGMSQQELATRLGVSFQQIQKYEKGDNQVSLAKAIDIAGVFAVSIESMVDAKFASVQPLVAANRESAKLMKGFLQIHDSRVRQQITSLVLSLAKDKDE